MSQSAYRIEFKTHDTHLCAYVSGPEDSAALSRLYWREIRDKSLELKRDKVILVADFPNYLAVTDLFDCARNVAVLFRNYSTVVLVDPKLTDPSHIQFAEEVARNAGLEGKIFTTLKDAEAWVLALGEN